MSSSRSQTAALLAHREKPGDEILRQHVLVKEGFPALGRHRFSTSR